MITFNQLKIGDVIEKKGYLWNVYKVDEFIVSNYFPQSPKNGMLVRSVGSDTRETVWENEFDNKSYEESIFVAVEDISKLSVDPNLYRKEYLKSELFTQ